MRVLIAEDDLVTARILRSLLECDGHTTTVVHDGVSALAALQADDAQELALIDWVMPDVSGPDICRTIRERADIVPTYLILLTARNTPADVVTGLDAGADDYLVKPFNPEELRARVRAGERIRHLEQHLAGQIHQLETALTKVDRLSGLLPICSYCKAIRDDADYWHRVEEYVSDHSNVQFSHGICPGCLAALEKQESLDLS